MSKRRDGTAGDARGSAAGGECDSAARPTRGAGADEGRDGASGDAARTATDDAGTTGEGGKASRPGGAAAVAAYAGAGCNAPAKVAPPGTAARGTCREKMLWRWERQHRASEIHQELKVLLSRRRGPFGKAEGSFMENDVA